MLFKCRLMISASFRIIIFNLKLKGLEPNDQSQGCSQDIRDAEESKYFIYLYIFYFYMCEITSK